LSRDRNKEIKRLIAGKQVGIKTLAFCVWHKSFAVYVRTLQETHAPATKRTFFNVGILKQQHVRMMIIPKYLILQLVHFGLAPFQALQKESRVVAKNARELRGSVSLPRYLENLLDRLYVTVICRSTDVD
jgi:hypothetical protein